ncbi:glycogen debranching protein GlgX [Rhodoluna sp.]|uniref:glycogen debranching protein GlgX n=1 Tax=Rhodoluna sp. TaxID=1969481 RepID=UPI0025DF39AC|nr:glycogen debranching protein GlgX [Rhodoluna sp.]
MSSIIAAGQGQLGVTIENGIGTIRVYSETATFIELCILNSDDPRTVAASVELQAGADHIWSGSHPKLIAGAKYALRADGPDGPRDGFNNALFLIDPYARGVIRESAREYHCQVIASDFDWQGVEKPNTALEQTIIYEAHPRGLTRGNQDLPDELRGTYAALGHHSTIAHLKNIGVTAVELLPIHMFISEPRLMNMGLINYWGYNTINFFMPHPRYASRNAIQAGPTAIIDELKTSIRELHRNGIEVILDVVYNHTAEGGGGGLTYSFRGLDNSNYYRQDDNGHYHDTTGCGNSLNFANPQVVALTIESLRYWTEEMQVDGFRFDLATTLARDASNTFDPGHPLLRAIVDDPIFANSKMIMEPWDVGLGGWQTGNFPDRFAEWNDRYRDSIRKFWLSDVANARNSGQHWNGVADLATRLSGSRDIIDGPSGPLGGVNFITAHDGFCLRDLVSYDTKHNQVNGESNRDGTNGNHSFNHGHEGAGAPQEVRVARRKAARNLMATMMFSAGIPMVTAGDERLKTQNGNNNAYCQDTVLSWVNWDLEQHEIEFEETFAYLTKLRHGNPVLRPKAFGDFNIASGDQDLVKWYNADGEIMTGEDWQNTECRTISRFTEHLLPDGGKNAMLLVIHGAETAQVVRLPEGLGADDFELLWNSADEVPPAEMAKFSAGAEITMSHTSIQLFRAV